MIRDFISLIIIIAITYAFLAITPDQENLVSHIEIEKGGD